MVSLRSREIPFPAPGSCTKDKPRQERPTPEPITPAKIHEPLVRQSSLSQHSGPSPSTATRRSVRLASKSVDQSLENVSRKRKMNAAEGDEQRGNVEENNNCASKRKVVYVNNISSGSSSVVDIIREEISNGNLNVEENGSAKKSKTEGKRKLTEEFEEIQSKGFVVNENCDPKEFEDNKISNLVQRKSRYSTEEKGKAKFDDDASNSADKDALELELESKVKDLVASLGDSVNVALENERQTRNINRNIDTNTRKNERRMDQFRDIARRNASRFAQFNHQEEEILPPEVDAQVPSAEENEEIEDWPGPFSTAMKIIRDRTKKLNSPGISTLDKAQSVPITWVPRSGQGLNWSRASAPSLQDLCMKIIVRNADAVSSLDHVPDALRHRLCQLLCDCRKMNSCFLDLLVRGSPTEIRIKDCSWMTEEEFVKSFESCATNNLKVLQLDQCGRCMPDYILPATLARSSRSLPDLITLSLSGACRLSDIGLSSLVASAVSLRSINLSRCSLLTFSSVGIIADSLGSVLRELYIDDCESIDVMLILPALKKLEHLEVLSVAGIQTVCDDFLRQFLVSCGHNIKELGLADCMQLTDSSLKVIAETCPRLCALDLVNLRKLTDSSLGYLANGCREIKALKLCLNSFSDEGVAAFLESSGELLKELTLNNVKKVGHNTAISLAKRSRNLINLDLSWCRNLTDEALGLIVDTCPSLRVLKLFGCDQITNVFLNGHRNSEVKIVGIKLSALLDHIYAPDSQEFPLRYSSAP
ncbi:uncharacterized protein LOC126667272 [Mercurialis annua]|uniref:uncharacterized protein LOC126667272 n=1 Tax=Mercurialis annua TaxID=3986 RepID=UPI00215FA219|nr:uncharacterized protein LOC126667272 [Mercurialis annua]